MSLQGLGIADRYGNMHLLARNLALVCHGVGGGWEEGSCPFHNKHFFSSSWPYLPLGKIASMSWGEVLGDCFGLPSLLPLTVLPRPPLLADHMPDF